jgi:hypothetical protein
MTLGCTATGPEDETMTASTIASATDTSDADSDADSESETDSASSTTGNPGGPPGCGITPECDKGTLMESVYRISSSSQISEIAGYSKVFGSLEIDGTDLECLDFLACLTEVGGDVFVTNNDDLLDLSGIDNLRDIGTEFSVAGSLSISNNNAMVDMNGFNSLRQTTISFVFNRNESVEVISGLTGLIAVQRDLTIRDNPELQRLTGLHDLKAVGGGFRVTQNPKLCISEVNLVGGDLEQGPDLETSTTVANKSDC